MKRPNPNLKTSRFPLLLSPIERKLYEKLASEQGQSLGAWFRTAARALAGKKEGQ